MSTSSYHVIPNSKGGWSVKKRGASKATKTFDNKVLATSYGKVLSQKSNSVLVIHKKDGTIQERITSLSKSRKTTTRVRGKR